MISQKNVTHVFVGADLNAPANTVTRATLANGAIGVFAVGSKTCTGVNALTSGSRYTVVLKDIYGNLIESPVFTYGQEVSKAAINYAAPTSQTSAIGFNGTSGAIVAANSTNYVVHVFWKDQLSTFQQGVPVKFAAYKSDATATQVEIANGLVVNFNKNFSRETPKTMKAEILINDAGVATSGGTGSLTNGSKYMTIAESAGAAADAGKYNADGATIVAGDYIRLGGGAVTDPCYKVTAISGGGTALATLTLDTPYQGTTNAALAAASMEVIAAATAAGADCGVKLSALDLQTYFEPGIVKQSTLTYDVTLGEDFGATPYTKLTAGSPGAGSYQEVAHNEWFLKGNRGETWRVGNYPKQVKLNAVSTLTYNAVVLNFAEKTANTIGAPVYTYGTILMYAPVAGNNIYASLKTIFGL